MGKGSMWLYVGSIALVIAAIVVTAVIDRSKSQQEDIRAKANVTSGQVATATVSSIDETGGTMMVTAFAIGTSAPAGSNDAPWTIAISGVVNTSTIGPGMKVQMELVPTSVNISAHTATAIKVSPSR